MRDDGVIQSQAVLVAIGINWDGHRQLLAIELANRESHSSWREFWLALKQRGLRGVEVVVSDDQAGLKRRGAPGSRLAALLLHQELRWLYDRPNLTEAQRDLAAWLQRWQRKYPKLTDWSKSTSAAL